MASKPKQNALQKAVEHVGSQSELARLLAKETGRPVRQGHVWKWLRNKSIPAEYAIPIEKVTDRHVLKEHLCPNIYREY